MNLNWRRPPFFILTQSITNQLPTEKGSQNFAGMWLVATGNKSCDQNREKQQIQDGGYHHFKCRSSPITAFSPIGTKFGMQTKFAVPHTNNKMQDAGGSSSSCCCVQSNCSVTFQTLIKPQILCIKKLQAMHLMLYKR